MEYSQKNIATICIGMLIAFFCMIIYSDSVDAQSRFNRVDSTSLESIFINQTGSMSEVAQINVVGKPITLLDVESYSKIYVAGGPFRQGDMQKPVLREEAENGSVTVISTVNNTVIKNIPVGVDPSYMYLEFRDIEIKPFSRPEFIYVTNSISDTVSVIDTRNDTVINTIPVGKGPVYIYGGVNTNFNHQYFIYVSNYLSNSVSIINTTEINNPKLIAEVEVGTPAGDAAGPTFIEQIGDHIYVTNSKDNTVSQIEKISNYTVIKNCEITSYED